MDLSSGTSPREGGSRGNTPLSDWPREPLLSGGCDAAEAPVPRRRDAGFFIWLSRSSSPPDRGVDPVVPGASRNRFPVVCARGRPETSPAATPCPWLAPCDRVFHRKSGGSR